MSIPSIIESVKSTLAAILSSGPSATASNASDWKLRTTKLYEGFSHETQVSMNKVSRLYAPGESGRQTLLKLMNNIELSEKELQDLSKSIPELPIKKFWGKDPGRHATIHDCERV